MVTIFIHGLGQTPLSWTETMQSLDSVADIYLPDLAEMLQADATSYEHLYQTFSEYCNGISQPVNLCGLSLGGILALQYAIEHPSQVESMILIGTQYKVPKMLMTFQTMIFRCMPQRLFQQMGFGKKQVIMLSKSMVNIDLEGRLKEVKCPVLLLCGERDGANKKASLEMAEKFPDSRFELIEKAGHEVNVEQPEKLATVIREFYKEFSQSKKVIKRMGIKK